MATNADMKLDFEEWKAMGEGGLSPTWEGYLSVLDAEKKIAFHDTLSPAIYNRPELYATG
jgi:hypothetical protein